MAFMRGALAMDPDHRLSSEGAVCHALFEGQFEDYAARHPHLLESREAADGSTGGASSR